jgi:membrane fusion protein, heavy metal efflux system
MPLEVKLLNGNKSKMKCLITKIVVLLSILILINISCRRKKPPVVKEPPFCINDSLFSNLNFDTVMLSQVENEVKLTGKITFNEDKLVKIFPFAGGVIEKLDVELGDYVTQGQTLALIRSSEIVDFENQQINAKSNLDVARKNLQVAEDMFNGKLATEKELILAQTDAQKAEGEYSRIKKILKIYGESKESSICTIKAPISGCVVEKNISEGMQFRADNATNILTISNLENLWAVANVYESDISKIKLGQEAIVYTIAYPDKKFVGKIDKIFNVLDVNSKVEKIKIKITNKENLLKPEMFAYTVINYKEDKYLPKIPSKAIVFDKSRNYVLVYKNKCKVEVREVKISKIIQNYTYIEKGLENGEIIINGDHLLIYSAINQ